MGILFNCKVNIIPTVDKKEALADIFLSIKYQIFLVKEIQPPNHLLDISAIFVSQLCATLTDSAQFFLFHRKSRPKCLTLACGYRSNTVGRKITFWYLKVVVCWKKILSLIKAAWNSRILLWKGENKIWEMWRGAKNFFKCRKRVKIFPKILGAGEGSFWEFLLYILPPFEQFFFAQIKLWADFQSTFTSKSYLLIWKWQNIFICRQLGVMLLSTTPPTASIA